MKPILLLAAATLVASETDLTRLLDRQLTVAQRNDACYALRDDRGSATANAMEGLLHDDQLRSCAAAYLGRQRQWDALHRAARDKTPEVRAAAIRQLGAAARAEDLSYLIAGAHDPHLLVAANAIQMLGAYPDREAVRPALLELARVPGGSGNMALAVAASLREPGVIDVARSLLRESVDASTRLAALRACIELGDETDLPLLRKIADIRQPISNQGRGFGFFPTIDLGQVARRGVLQLERRLGIPSP